jgi:hypothetical protein
MKLWLLKLSTKNNNIEAREEYHVKTHTSNPPNTKISFLIRIDAVPYLPEGPIQSK